MTASESKPPYLRALLYFLTAPFQSWDLKRLFPIFFTSSATDRTFSIWKEARAKVKLEPLILICSFCHHSSCLCKNKEKETLLTLQTQSLTSRISKQLYFKVKLKTCTTMTSVIIWLIITGNTFPPASIIYQTKHDLDLWYWFFFFNPHSHLALDEPANKHIEKKCHSAPCRAVICQPESLKIKDSADTYIFKVDVGVFGEVWVGICSITWCSAPAVPILMLTTVSYDTWLQMQMLAETLR